MKQARGRAPQGKEEELTVFFHHLSVDLFRERASRSNRDAAPGVDALTERSYKADLEHNLTDLAQAFNGEGIGHCYRSEFTYHRPILGLQLWVPPKARSAIEHAV